MAAKRKSEAKRPTIAGLLADRDAPRLALTADQLSEVRAALENNERQTAAQLRIGLKRMRAHLRDHYDFAGSERDLERAVCAALGRSSWVSG